MAWVRRSLEGALARSLRDSPVVFVQGARQTGKSTLVRHMRGAEARPYFTLDDAATLAAAEGDPTGFVSGLGEAVVIDEVQRAPGLALAIKAAVDRGRRPGRFLLTGSANALVLPKLAEALAGRIEIHTLWPLSQGELEGRRETFLDAVFSGHFRVAGGGESEWPGLVERMGRGGYPEMLSRSSEERRRAWFGSYVTSIVQRDVRDITNIRDVSDLPRLLALVGTRAASLLDYADIARGTGIPQTTVKRHMALLEATFLVQTLPAWFTNIGKRLVKAPKMLINDTGLLMYLLGTGTERLREDRTLGGSMLENFVAMELFKQSGWSKVQPKLHHFRTHGGEEVDLVLEDREGRIVGIEVKASASVNGGTFRGLQALAQAAGNKFVRGVVLYTGGAAVSFGEKLVAAPVDALWG